MWKRVNMSKLAQSLTDKKIEYKKMKNKLLKIHPNDNVAVALVNLQESEVYNIGGQTVEVIESIDAKHKITLQDIKEGDVIRMYGVVVGKAVKNIDKGGRISTQNIKHQSSEVIDKKSIPKWIGPNADQWKSKTFNGYHRGDGQVGTANIWLFFPLVFCENRNVEILKEVFENELLQTNVNEHRLFLRSLISGEAQNDLAIESKEKSILDNIELKFLTHQGGCGGVRQDSHSLARLLAGYVNNPNVAGATVLSLGCQNLEVNLFKDALNALNPNIDKPVLIYDQQKMGTVKHMIKTIIAETFQEILKANKIERKPAPLSKLCIGLECGGSDGFSGISANPTLGHMSDLMANLGGTTILAEFPELCGVEQELVNRCVDTKTADKFLHLMKSYEQTAIDAGSGFDANPSPGNIKDGLITDAIKSAGAAKKGGTSPITGVLDYTEYVENAGLNLLCTPGNDVESTTAMVGSGANLVVFTTGLGTPTGNPITPIIKVSTNNYLAQKMSDIIDFNAGAIVEGEKTIEEMGENLLELIIEVASGEVKTKADILNQNDFIPWKRGVSL